ncbi:CARDB domain-containing protein [Nocardioides dubius]|uniref:Ig-like domain-containing protein n=1 Tax=Nocardioides dubius TaxID=317019 RepID=A0ABP4E4K2_9ACTN
MSRFRDILRTTAKVTAVATLLASASLLSTGVPAASAGPAPELRVSSVTNPPASRLPGQAVRSVAVLKNAGRATARRSTTALWLSNDRTVGAGDRKLRSRPTPSLARSRSTRVVVTAPVPRNMPTGSYFVIACADSAKKVKESNEANNCRSSRRAVRVVRASLSITAPVSGAVVGPSVAVSFVSNVRLATTCSIDGRPGTPCTSGDAQLLTDGAHSVTVTGTDAAGNVVVASRSFTVDATPAVLAFTTPPPTQTNDTTPTFAFAADEPGSSLECRVDEAPFEECTSPFTTAELASGPHTIDVTATDPVGNVSGTLSHEVTIDTDAPSTTIDDHPAADSNDATADFAFSSTEDGTFECRVLPAEFSTCTSPFATAPLTAGSHTFEVRATDQAGNVDPTPAAFTFSLDLTPPQTTLTGTPPAITDDPTAVFTFASPEPAAFECRIDADPFASCASPHTTATLDDGTHTFEVRAVDSVGNADPTPASHTFDVDTRAPNTTLTQTPASLTNNPLAQFHFVSDDAAASFECKVDGAAFAPCSSPFTTSALSDGTHTVSVRAVRNGLGDLTPATFTFEVDKTEPETTLTSTEPNPTNDETADFTFTADEAGATFECRVDNGAYAGCASPFSTPPTGGGTHTFRVRAIDSAGNVDASPASHTWVVDVIAPITTLSTAPANPTTDRTADFTFSSTESGTFRCSLNNAPAAPCTSPHSTASLADGSYTFSVYAVDAAGNVDATPESHSFRVDVTGPTFSISSPPAANSGSYITKDPQISFAGFPFDASGIASVTWTNSAGGSGSAVTAAGNWLNFQIWNIPLAVGANTITITGTDTLGNVNQKIVVVTRDASAPTVTITAPTAASTLVTSAGSVMLGGTASDNLGIAGVAWSNSAGGSGTASGTTSWSTAAIPLVVGANTITVTVTDTAGNTSTDSLVVTRDNTGPSVSISTNGGTSYATTASTVQLTGSASDPSGIELVTWRIPSTGSTGGAIGTTSWTTTIIALSPGPNYIEVTAYDRAGNPTTTSIEVTRT